MKIANIFLILGLLLQSCAYQVPKPEEKGLFRLKEQEALQVVQELDPSSQGLTSWQDLGPALRRSLEYVQAKPPQEQALQIQELEITWGCLARNLELLLELLPRLDQEPGLLAESFAWFELRPGPLFTGYYQYELEASLQPSQEYTVPLFGPPEDLQIADLGDFHPRWQGQSLVYRVHEGRIEPYPDRKSIELENVLQDKAPVLAWAKDQMDVFFLQIQGSGLLRLPDGSVQNIGYAAKNDRPHVSLGRELARQGHLEPHDLSMESIQEYLRQNPELMPDILFSNPNFVFFRLTEAGPFGAMGRELTPMVSLATDRDILALGTVLAYSVALPEKGSADKLQTTALGLAQDVGGAIQGHHLDVFFGAGQEARYRASGLKNKGSVYLLLAEEIY